MKAKNIIYMVMAMFVIGMTGCGEDFLETPDNASLSITNFYKTKDDLDKALTAAYSVFKAADLDDGKIVGQTFCNGHFILGNATSDDSEIGGGFGEATDMVSMSKFSTPTNIPLLQNVWTGLYQGIYRSNLIIQNTPNALDEVTDELKRKYIAEAKFVRSYCYFKLVRVFGPVPLIVEPLSADQFYTVTRNPLSEIYNQIRIDLTEAAADLPWVDKFDGHANRGSAYGLLSKVLLFESSFARNYPGDERFSGLQERWGEAYDAANQLMTSGMYDLSVNYSKIFQPAGENSKESVFEIQFMTYGDSYHARNNGNTFAVNNRSRSMGGWGFDLPTQNLVDAFENGYKTFTTGEWKTTGNAADSAIWVDPRMTWTIVFDGEPAWYDPSKTMTNGEGLTQLYTGYCNKKILTPVYELTGNFSNHPNNLRLLRYADVILIAAEAAFYMGNEAKAIELVNMVRDRARRDAVSTDALPPIPNTVSGTNLLNVIKHERRIELAMEGHRFWDLIRWGDAKEVLKKYFEENTLYTVDDPFIRGVHEFMPIPLNEIRNSKGALTQNYGY